MVDQCHKVCWDCRLEKLPKHYLDLIERENLLMDDGLGVGDLNELNKINRWMSYYVVHRETVNILIPDSRLLGEHSNKFRHFAQGQSADFLCYTHCSLVTLENFSCP